MEKDEIAAMVEYKLFNIALNNENLLEKLQNEITKSIVDAFEIKDNLFNCGIIIYFDVMSGDLKARFSYRFNEIYHHDDFVIRKNFNKSELSYDTVHEIYDNIKEHISKNLSNHILKELFDKKNLVDKILNA